jgi:hypothetical protein
VKPQPCPKTFQLLSLLNQNSNPCKLQEFPKPPRARRLKTICTLKKKKTKKQDSESALIPLESGCKLSSSEGNLDEMHLVDVYKRLHAGLEMKQLQKHRGSSESRVPPSKPGIRWF